MKLNKFTAMQIESAIQALITANEVNMLGGEEKSKYTSLHAKVTLKENQFIIAFYVYLYEDAEEPQIKDILKFNLDTKYKQFIEEVCYYIVDTFNSYKGYEMEEDYKF